MYSLDQSPFEMKYKVHINKVVKYDHEEIIKIDKSEDTYFYSHYFNDPYEVDKG